MARHLILRMEIDEDLTKEEGGLTDSLEILTAVQDRLQGPASTNPNYDTLDEQLADVLAAAKVWTTEGPIIVDVE